ncbi:MAG: methionyl-tRNA formyltransferase [Verrucomicrobia bacterium]|nr:methionyl-tRNA formyltransferase [Verrucomicrobiota bacterium]
MRIVFMGTADFGAPCLEALVGAREHQVVGIVTQPDRPVGRRQELMPPPIKTLALKHGLPVFQPEKIRRLDAVAELRALSPELIVVVAYGQILPKDVLTMPRLGCVNVHGSLLPRWRGASPIQAALLAGDESTGVTTMLLDEGMDTGPMLMWERVEIAPDDNAATLHGKLAALGATLLMKTVAALAAGALRPTPQPVEGVTCAPKIKKENGLVDWTQSARQIRNRLRAFTPWPGLFTHLPAEAGPRVLKIWTAAVAAKPAAGGAASGTVMAAGKDGIAVATGEGMLVMRELQIEGGRRMSAEEFLKGRRLDVGIRLGGEG